MRLAFKSSKVGAKDEDRKRGAYGYDVIAIQCQTPPNKIDTLVLLTVGCPSNNTSLLARSLSLLEYPKADLAHCEMSDVAICEGGLFLMNLSLICIPIIRIVPTRKIRFFHFTVSEKH